MYIPYPIALKPLDCSQCVEINSCQANKLMVKIFFSTPVKNQIAILTIYFIKCLGVTSSVLLVKWIIFKCLVSVDTPMVIQVPGRYGLVRESRPLYTYLWPLMMMVRTWAHLQRETLSSHEKIRSNSSWTAVALCTIFLHLRLIGPVNAFCQRINNICSILDGF